MVEPRLFFCPVPRFSQVAGMLSVRGLRENASARLPSSAAQPVDPACSLIREGSGLIRPCGGTIPARIPTLRALRVMHSTPQNASRDTSRVRFLRAGSGLCFRVLLGPFVVPNLAQKTRPKIRADKSFTRGPKAWRSGHFGTLVGATGGNPNTLAPNRLKTRPCPSHPSRTSTSF